MNSQLYVIKGKALLMCRNNSLFAKYSCMYTVYACLLFLSVQAHKDTRERWKKWTFSQTTAPISHRRCVSPQQDVALPLIYIVCSCFSQLPDISTLQCTGIHTESCLGEIKHAIEKELHLHGDFLLSAQYIIELLHLQFVQLYQRSGWWLWNHQPLGLFHRLHQQQK